MSNATAFLLVAAVSAVTYLSRAGMVLLLAGRELPEPVTRALRNVGPAVLAALVVTFVADPEEANQGVTAAEAIAIVAASGVHWFRKNLALTLVFGMAVFWVARELI